MKIKKIVNHVKSHSEEYFFIALLLALLITLLVHLCFIASFITAGTMAFLISEINFNI